MSRAPGRPLVALAGNPNTGKTTLFNALTGGHARVGNYPGVTVERRTGTATLSDGVTAEILDIPGTYSLVASSAEERIAIEAMLGLRGHRRPDLCVVCVDATQPARGLYLVLQAQELGLNLLVALTLMDEAGPAAPDPRALAERLGCPVVPLAARRGGGLAELRAAIAARLAAPDTTPRWRWRPSAALAARLAETRAQLPPGWPHSDAMALWALMSLDPQASAGDALDAPPALRATATLDDAAGRAVDDEAIRGRYDFIDRTLAALAPRAPDRRASERIDRWLTHPALGLVAFATIMFLVFQALFAGAEPFVSLIEDGVAALGTALRAVLPPGVLADFLVEGVVGGVGAVLAFLPQILLLFFFLGMLEDSGYMARVAYLVDRLMRTMNLHGRAFVPLLSGFACAVPAILATRTMERQRDRLLTMLVIPLTTCSARLPIYGLLIAALFPSRRVLGVFPVQGLMLVGMYLFGIAAALIVAWVLSRTVRPLRARRLPFVIDLPPYRLPLLRDVARMMWTRSLSFLSDAGRVILLCALGLWVLLHFPRAPHEGPAAAADATTLASAPAASPDAAARRLEHSYAGRLGRALEPALAPLGFDWKIGVGIIGAFAAREVFVATMGVIYGVDGDPDEDPRPLRERLRAERRPDGTPLYTPLVGLTLMVFFALACQCMSTLAVVRRETRSLRWPLFLFAYMTALAWLAGLAVYQGGRALGLS